jgi:hypothetical protein
MIMSIEGSLSHHHMSLLGVHDTIVPLEHFIPTQSRYWPEYLVIEYQTNQILNMITYVANKLNCWPTLIYLHERYKSGNKYGKSMFVFFPFCDGAKVVIICKKIYPNMAIN